MHIEQVRLSHMLINHLLYVTMTVSDDNDK